MKIRSLIGLVVLLTLALGSCTKRIDIGDFEADRWKADPKACTGDRADMLKQLQTVKPKLLGLYQKSIIKVLGEPEEQELYKRSQTYYIYYIDPAEACDNGTENPRKLEVRFTALGIANEVNIR